MPAAKNAACVSIGKLMNVWAIVVAAGQGARLLGYGRGLPKQFLPLNGLPLFYCCARVFARVPSIGGLVFVLPHEWPAIPAEAAQPFFFRELREGPGVRLGPEELIAAYEGMIRQLEGAVGLGLPWQVVLGGKRRQDSVARGLAALPQDCEAVLVHDGARPFVSAALIGRVLQGLRSGAAAVIPGLPLSDTVKEVDADGRVARTLERSSLRAVQTPQGFSLEALRMGHARAVAEGWETTDDASLLERCGVAVQLTQGEESNRKITTPEDLRLLAGSFGEPFQQPPGQEGEKGMSFTLRQGSMVPCSGFGYDVHRYGGNRPYILGGVPIACEVMLKAHSDGDVALHALMDAMLGCIGGGDIGLLFPDHDPSLDNIPSGVLLSEVLERCERAGLVICNVDLTIVAQTPRIAPHRQAIAANVAKMLALPLHAVNVKATTEEGLGFTGEKKGVKAYALVSGLRPERPLDHSRQPA